MICMVASRPAPRRRGDIAMKVGVKKTLPID
jgi:hypothetical protein